MPIKRWEELSDVVSLYDARPRDVRAYLKIRWAAFRQFQTLLDWIPERACVLDLGCGYGLFSLLAGLRKNPARVFGVDLSTKRIETLQGILDANPSLQNIAAAQCDLRDTDRLRELCRNALPPGRNHWDAIFCIDTLYYLPDREKSAVLSLCRELADDKGILILKDFDRTPTLKNITLNVEEYAVNFFKLLVNGAKYRNYFEGKLHFIHRRETIRLIEDAGFDCQVVPMHEGTPHPHVAYVCGSEEILKRRLK